jgi:hypothetical protein
MTQHPPRRLLDDPSLDAGLRSDLTHAQAERAAYDVQAGLSALNATLDRLDAAPPMDRAVERPAPSELQVASGQSLRAFHGRWWAWTAAGVASVSAVWWLQREPEVPPTGRAGSEREVPLERADTSPTAQADTLKSASTAVSQSEAGFANTLPPSRGARATAAKTRVVPARAAPHLGASEGTAKQAPPSASAANQAGASHAADQAPAPVGEVAPDPAAPRPDGAELEHLARVRRLLASAPREALDAARAGQAQFARGLFTEERAGLIIFALERVGQTDAALREGRQFLRAYPGGPFAARVREIVARLEKQSL